MKKHITKSQNSTVKINHLRQINVNVAGIDIGANSIFVCAGLPDGFQQVREFLTFTSDLKAMAKWLKECKVKSVAMESTGVYWIAPYDILAEMGFEVLLVNPHSIKSINRNKSDVMDCEWIQELHSYGLLKGSFRPNDHGVTFRGYVRQRDRLIKDSAIQIQLMHKALTQMNIQLRQVLSDITGSTGMQIIRAIVAGEHNPKVLAKYRNYRCKRDEATIVKSLEGNFRPELIFALRQALEAYDFFQAQIIACEKKITGMVEDWDQENNQPGSVEKLPEGPDQNALALKLEDILKVDLTEIPGISDDLAVRIISEIGTDITRWPTQKHFASWLGLCPGTKISGGKILSSRTKPISNKAAQAFRIAAYTLHKSKTALGAFFRRMRSRIGAPKAITATAHKIAKIVYTMLHDKVQFVESGQNAYEQKYQERVIAKIKRKASELGYVLVKNEVNIAGI
jgi:transposase